MIKTDFFLNQIERIASRIVSNKEDGMTSVQSRARESLLDYLAVTLAGAYFQKKKINRYMQLAHPEAGDVKAIGIGKLALKEAVFLNGINGHALDLDDGIIDGIIHPGAPIFSLLLPLAERYDKAIYDVLTAAIIGYETSYMIATTIQPYNKNLGYHATATCGILGTALSACYMLELNENVRFNAFSAACSSATGALSAQDEGSELKPYNVGMTALLALTSIQMAMAGFKGNPDPLGSHRGYIKMMTGRTDIGIKTADQDESYAIMKAYTKPYASCRYTHPAVEAAIFLRESINPDEVDKILIRTYKFAVDGHDHVEISGSYSAKMSIPYSFAVSFLCGKAGLTEFSEEYICRNDILRFIRCIKVEADETLSAFFPRKQSAIVTVRKKNGTEIIHRVDIPKGEPNNPISAKEFKERFFGLMDYAKNSNGDKILDIVKNGGSIRELMKLM